MSRVKLKKSRVKLKELKKSWALMVIGDKWSKNQYDEEREWLLTFTQLMAINFHLIALQRRATSPRRRGCYKPEVLRRFWRRVRHICGISLWRGKK